MAEAGDRPKEEKRKKEKEIRNKKNKKENIKLKLKYFKIKINKKLYKFTKRVFILCIFLEQIYQTRFFVQKLFPRTKILFFYFCSYKQFLNRNITKHTLNFFLSNGGDWRLTDGDRWQLTDATNNGRQTATNNGKGNQRWWTNNGQ